MTVRSLIVSGVFAAAIFFAPGLVRAQVAVLGKGFFLDAGGSIASGPSDVISGRNSIKGAYAGPNSYTEVFSSDPTFVQFAANETYMLTMSYRILTAGSQGFSFGFFSKTGYPASLVRTGTINGSAGTSGTATHTVTLLNFSDYQFQFKIDGTGAIVIDDFRITNQAGQVVASENAEGPTLGRGPLNFEVTHAISYPLEASAKPVFGAVRDLDGDAYPETILGFKAPRPSTTLAPILLVESRARLNLAAREFFPSGVPVLKYMATGAVFADFNRDGLEDVAFSEAGSDGETANGDTFPGSRIGVALNLGGGKYRDVSSLVPADFDVTRSYSLAAGDLDGDGRPEIVLPDQTRGTNTALLRWNGDRFEAQRNWIDTRLWSSPGELRRQTWLGISDMDNDGKQDLIVGGDPKSPNLRILFGAGGGRFVAADLIELPDGPFGHAELRAQTDPVIEGAESCAVVADFNNDGLRDLFLYFEQVRTYLPGAITDTNHPSYADVLARGGSVAGHAAFQVFINQGSRRFADVTSASPVRMLGRRYYQMAFPVDMNNDGFQDVVGHYLTQYYAGVKQQWGTTFFLNDGAGAFQVVDADQLLPVTTTPANGQTWGLGAFVPTVVNAERTEGIVYEPVGWSGGAGYAFPTLNLYRVYANRALGTGPNFEESARLGVPGFNEFFYLRTHPDAAASVERGEYRSGLAHYLAVGRDRGYTPSARARQAP